MTRRRRYAENTSVSVEKSEAEIRGLLRRYGAEAYGQMEANGLAQIVFQLRERRIVFRVRLPERNEKRFLRSHGDQRARTPESAYAAWEQGCRQKWRALALCIKAKLEAVDAGIETFDQAFLAHVMLPDGRTVGDWAAEALPGALEGRPLPPLIEGPRHD